MKKVTRKRSKGKKIDIQGERAVVQPGEDGTEEFVGEELEAVIFLLLSHDVLQRQFPLLLLHFDLQKHENTNIPNTTRSTIAKQRAGKKLN